MYNIYGNLFDPESYAIRPGIRHPADIMPDAICITTNGFVKKNGEAVMGRGCARQAAELMPGLPEILGNALTSQGLQVYAHGPWSGMEIVSFPVKCKAYYSLKDQKAEDIPIVRHMRKHFKPGDIIPGWACIADLAIIKGSAINLISMANERNWQHVILPRPGCGAGELKWKDVEPTLQDILDDRFYCITY